MPRPGLAASAPQSSAKRAAENFRGGAITHEEIQRDQEVPMKCGFPTHLVAQRRIVCARIAARADTFARTQSRQCRRIHPTKKICAERLRGACRKAVAAQKRANQCQPIRAGDTFRSRSRRLATMPRAKFLVPFRHARSACGVFFGARGDAPPLRLESDALLQEIVDRLRVGFATRCLHHLADEPADRFRIGFGVGYLVRMLGNDVVNECSDRGNVGHLL